MKDNKRYADEQILPPDDIEQPADDKIEEDASPKPKGMTSVKKARLLIAGIIIVLLAVLLVIYGSRLNYDNFRRFFVKIGYNFQSDKAPKETFEFPSASDARFIGFKGGAAVLSGGRLSVYDDRGYLLSENAMACKTPAVKTSGKYILCFDLGGNSLALFNSFDRVFELTTEKEITNASIGLGNHLAVCTYADEHKSRVAVYDTTFSPVFTVYRFDRYVTAAECSPDNRILAVAGVYPDSAETVGEILFFRYGESDSFASCSFGEEFPHTMFYKKSGLLFAVTDKGVYFIGKDGAVVSTTDINGKNVAALAYNDEYTAVAVADGGTERAEIFIFDGSGKTVRSFEADGPKKLSFGGDSLYYLTLSGLYGVKIKTGETRGYPAANATDLVAADKTVFLFSRGSGTVLNKE